MKVYIGVDVGATKTQALAVSEDGSVLGVATQGPGATYTVGYEGCTQVTESSIAEVLRQAGATKSDVAAAGFGVSGYDWPHEYAPTVQAMERLGLACPLAVHNDGDLPITAGASAGWGIAVSAGTGNIVTGVNQQGKYARSTGGSVHCGELGGAMELVYIAIQSVAYEYIRRGPPTRITDLMIAEVGARDTLDLLSKVAPGRVKIAPSFSRKIIEAALEGDAVAIELLRVSGRDLGLTTVGIIRQLDLQHSPFEVVLAGSMFKQMLPFYVGPMQEAILAEAPQAQFTPLNTLPVVGAGIFAMQQMGLDTGLRRAKIVQGVAAFAPTG